jgi:cytochrome c5
MMSISKQRYFPGINKLKVMSLCIVVVGVLLVKLNVWAQVDDRNGIEVVEAVCIACHGTGAQGAPTIGDKKAWRNRTSQGLTALAQNAIDGIRKMPAHGGNPNVSDLEIKRAVTYMVNLSGGSWTEPIGNDVSHPERNGEQVVQLQCKKCHQMGDGGAPKIGDMPAWIPRLKRGLDATIRSAVNGHGGMPPRGGLVNLTDAEIKNAIIYMLDPVSYEAKGYSSTPSEASDVYRKVIGGMEIYLGIVPAKAVEAEQREMHGGIPRGKDYYHINISLRDSNTKEEITDAQVKLTVKDPFLGDKSKELGLMVINRRISYGNYFQMKGFDSYSIKVHILRADRSPAINANFKYVLH